MAWVPTVIENEGGNRERAFDIYSRLLRDRIVIVGYSLGSFMAAITRAVDPRIRACVLAGGGNLDRIRAIPPCAHPPSADMPTTWIPTNSIERFTG